ncbi:sodium-coupled monocarboxylate transporter 1 [Episyrphus balteatus]|uniref:sodium-coupled monocarboxylate transporter 1 n=1 Tax=Episyrphus balteatus TaxID=286459 RepID=UPI002486AF5F|nr:sodium-coupled monocarboxylate transporter 1 [Episyrphus balteatus]
MTNVHDVKVRLQKFGWPDYMVFVIMLLSCVFIGVYFALKMRHERKKRKNDSNKDAEDSYLVGGRNMKTFPIAMSLISSFISGITLLGTPTEIYLYGIQYIYVVGALLLMGVAMYYVFLPVFHDLKLISTYQYLETRFDQRVRLFGSVLFTVGSLMWLPIVIYVPALAFNQATGINIHWVTPLVGLVCIFYTCVGGLQAVVWTDVVQAILMFGAMILIIVKGTIDIGGPRTVLERAWTSGRIESPNWRFDLRERHTVYSLLLGGFPHWLKSNAVNQNMIQRYLSLPTLRTARQALWVFVLGVFLLLAICCYSGLLIYATYSDCDPLTTKLATRKDQLLPLLVMETLGDFPGLPGLFVAGVFSAALSSLSTGLNSMSAVVLEDFFKSFCKKPLTERQTAFIMRGVVVVFGALCVALVFVVEKLGTVLQLSMSLAAVSNGPLLGIFTMAVLIPWVEGRGAIIGGTTGLAIMSWIVAKAQAAIATGELSFITKPLTTSGCSYTFIAQSSLSMLAINATTEQTAAIPPIDVSFKIYHISYLYYTMLGAVITMMVAIATSFLLGPNKPSEVDPKLLAPFVRRLIGCTRKNQNVIETGKAPLSGDKFTFTENFEFSPVEGDVHSKNTSKLM